MSYCLGAVASGVTGSGTHRFCSLAKHLQSRKNVFREQLTLVLVWVSDEMMLIVSRPSSMSSRLDVAGQHRRMILAATHSHQQVNLFS
ncbi:MAG: hypothetical protein CMJ64_23110 [Planctomycetaceae bacterium]|nr:hypothetical protein [Planctomycetaceae bacterium]